MRTAHRVTTILPLLILLVALAPCARAAQRIDLNGSWRFTIDPMRVGQQWNWHGRELWSESQWTSVDTPHCWPVDPRFQHTGAAWYRRTFTVPKGAANGHVRLVFDTVFYRARSGSTANCSASTKVDTRRFNSISLPRRHRGK